jgi:hypothetical protein
MGTILATTIWGDLYRINPVAMTAALVGPSGGPAIKELALNESSQILFGTDYISLYLIDTLTGAAGLLGPLNAPGNVWAMDYDPSLDKLVAVSSDDDNMYYVDMGSGQATLVGPTGQDRITDIWYDQAAGQMFGVGNNPDQIYTLNTATGAATVLFLLPDFLNILGLGWFGDDAVPTEKAAWGEVKSMYR